MNACVLDASVAIKLAFDEPYSSNALALLQTTRDIRAPAHWLAEAATGLWSKVAVHRTLTSAEMQIRIGFLTALPIFGVPLAELVGTAADLSVELRLTVYDTLYLALAARDGVPLVSDDRRLIEAARGDGRFEKLVVWIGDVPF